MSLATRISRHLLVRQVSFNYEDMLVMKKRVWGVNGIRSRGGCRISYHLENQDGIEVLNKEYIVSFLPALLSALCTSED